MSSNPDFTENIVGTWGRWQLGLTIYIFLSKFSTGQHQVAIIYLAPKVDANCESEDVGDVCSGDCGEVQFNRSVFTETIVTDFNLICDRAYLTDLTQTLVMFGILVGNMSAGYFSDRFGRKNVFSTYLLLQSVAGILCAFGPYYWLFMLLKFLSTVGTGGQMVTSYVLLIELVGKKHKTLIGALYQLPFNLGHLSLPLISYFLRNWRHYQITFSATTVPLVTYYCFLPESPRWLMTHNQKDKAVKVLTKGAKCNKLPTDNIDNDVTQYMATLNNQSSMVTDKKSPILFVLFRTKIMCMYTICICFNWFTCGLCYFGVSQYVGNLGGDVFLNGAISASLAIPGTLFVIYSAKYWGRKSTTMFMNICAAIPLLSMVFVPEDLDWIKSILASLSMFGLFGLFCNAYIYSGELFPTIARSCGLGVCSFCARIGSMIAPHISSNAPSWLAALIFGLFPLIGFFITCPLPETKDNSLPNTVDEAEDQYRNRKGFCR